MSSLILEAEAAFRRWRQMHPDDPAPPVAVYLSQVDRPFRFEGLAVVPTVSESCFALTGLGGDEEVIVVRDADVERIVINRAKPESVGFRPPEA